MSDDSSSDFDSIFENMELGHSKSKKKTKKMSKTKSKRNYKRSKLSKFKETFKYQSTCSSSSTLDSSSYTSTTTSSSEIEYTDQKKYKINKYFTNSTNSETGRNDQKSDNGYCERKYQSNTISSENVQNTNNTTYQMKKSKEINKNVNYSLNTKNKNKAQKKRSNSKKNKFVGILTFKPGSIKPIWEELAVWNIDYKYIFEDLTLDDINSLESTVLNYMNFKLSVNTPTYTNYYLELRNLSSFTILHSKKKTYRKLKVILPFHILSLYLL
ncbi:cyclin y [Anaeramoeba flamelloides]|uniref:Cyclin y n=1 Tax=Anaeramoeba flamelloides TaxID=1746091 RepID=A0ABQ8Z299_9EUKA|nr:cyclin y [Anaeramoeba flamelloides]